MRIGLAQINPTVGDIQGNAAKIARCIGQAKRSKVDLLVFSELALIGYPPRDLLYHESFLSEAKEALYRLNQQCGDVAVLLGSVRVAEDRLYNTAFLLDGGEITWQDKTLLPNYDVFDESRYFWSSERCGPMRFRGCNLGVHVCEDSWNDKDASSSRRYERDPIEELARQGVDIFINLSASPYHLEKGAQRRSIMGTIARKYGKPFLYVNQVGGNDELVFDGRSFLLDDEGALVAEAKDFEEDFLAFELENMAVMSPQIRTEGMAALEKALQMSIADYFAKTGFRQAVIGLSGGIDSAVTAALAVQALGSRNVLGVAMPSIYSSRESVEDAKRLAENLQIEFRVLPITPIFEPFVGSLSEGKYIMDLAEENLQARIRGNLLMTISNRENRLILTTGNKSEMAVGYCTMYGDMAGGLAVISDVPKTMIYQLAEHLNRDREVIPSAIIEKPPSAELRPGQLDTDSLPPYEILDPILSGLVENNRSVDEVVAEGYDRSTVERVFRMVQRNEYKRRQAPPGIRVTTRAFGSGRRYPIAQRWNPI
ncbi:NAD+ synthase [Heliobacillus mobilis]|uniref:Glutamine-dependent NAD(+) synthetase n=1 Tax=Heliobacterium mobile TaxID=28064 RepID=A0A6I3SL53_HELMO|nr:NAD+ synthase [Heliobacterium mobile]MTV49671.1 NAD+ synthase [Heliobacterium mobile]